MGLEAQAGGKAAEDMLLEVAGTPDAPAPAARAEGDSSERGIVFCVGNVLRGDDAAGPMLAKMLQERPLAGWEVIDGGQTPEDDLVVVKRTHPSRVVVVDAAAMGLPAGTCCRVDDADVKVSYLMSTHALPITLLLSEIRTACDDVSFIGIQPASTEFFDPLSPEVLAAVEDVYDCLAAGADLTRYPRACELRSE